MDHHDGEFVIKVNDVESSVAGRVLDGRKILAATGFRPVEDHVLIQLLFPGTRSVGLDEPVDLSRSPRNVFRAFKSDRIFRFTVNDRGYEWGAAEISQRELRAVAVVDPDGTLVLEREGDTVPLPADGILKLGDAGTEHLHVVELVTVYLNDDVEKKIRGGNYKTEDLADVLGVEPGYVLDVLEDGQLKPLEQGQTTEVRDGMKFYSHVPAGGSS